MSAWTWSLSLSRLLRLCEGKSRRIDAVAKPGRFRAIVEHVAQMGVASRAQRLRPFHEPTSVGLGAHVLRRDRVIEARPSRAGFELGLGPEQVGPAADAPVDPLLVVVPVHPGERPLGPLLPGNLELFGRKDLLPLLLRLIDFLGHDIPLLRSGIEFYFPWVHPFPVRASRRTFRPACHATRERNAQQGPSRQKNGNPEELSPSHLPRPHLFHRVCTSSPL